MPYFYTNAPDLKIGEYIATNLVGEIAKIVDSPVDWFYFINSSNVTLVSKQVDKNEVIIECKWFDRGVEVKSKIAKLIETKISEKFNLTTTIMFTKLDKDDFYEGGKGL